MINKSTELNELVKINRDLLNSNEILNCDIKLLDHENNETKINYNEILNESNLWKKEYKAVNDLYQQNEEKLKNIICENNELQKRNLNINKLSKYDNLLNYYENIIELIETYCITKDMITNDDLINKKFIKINNKFSKD